MVLQTFTFTDADWLENFRMGKSTFYYLCEKLRPFIERKNTRMRLAICVEHRIAITIWSLATCCEYRTIGHLFGVGRSTVCVIVHDTCKAIVHVLLDEYIKFPQGTELCDVVAGFKTKWGMIQCAGAIDGSHVPVTPPALQHTDYWTRFWKTILYEGTSKAAEGYAADIIANRAKDECMNIAVHWHDSSTITQTVERFLLLKEQNAQWFYTHEQVDVGTKWLSRNSRCSCGTNCQTHIRSDVLAFNEGHHPVSHKDSQHVDLPIG